MLTVADVRLIHMVAARRYGTGDATAVAGDRLAAAVSGQVEGETPFRRAASLAATLLRDSVFPTAALPTALLTLHCSLSLDGLMLLAPQGVVAGMIAGLAAGDDPTGMARWLEDRTVPSSGGG